MCRSEIRTTSPSTAAWNTFFRVISGKSRKSTAYDDRLSQEFQSDDSVRTECSSFLDEFSASSLSRYPWRLAVVELAIKLKLDEKTIAKPLGLLAARLENYPTWQRATDEDYTFHTIPKKSGGSRSLQEPSQWLKDIQRSLYRTIRQEVTPHIACHGFEQGRSILSNAQHHTGQPMVVRLDIKQAFESTSKVMVEHSLRRDLARFKFSDRTIAFLGELFTFRGFLPTGAPSSPFLLNRVFLEADIDIAAAAALQHVNYSRYADDLTFSGSSALSLGRVVRNVIEQLGYRINERKTRIYRKGNRQIVTGLVVNDTPNLPRETRRNLRAAVHHWATTGEASWKNAPMMETMLRGHLNFYAMVNPTAADRLLSQIENAEGR